MENAIEECKEIFSTVNAAQQITYRGRLVEYQQEILHPRKYIYAITDIVIQCAFDYRRLHVTLPAGVKLYEYINSGGRLSRLDEIYFEFDALRERQRVTAYRAIDGAFPFG